MSEEHLLRGFSEEDPQHLRSEEYRPRRFSDEDPDKLCYQPPASADDDSAQDYLLYFISGNPGIISFYEPFLSKLHKLRSISSNPRFHICGHSYKGFEISPHAQNLGGPFSLEQQIQDQENRLYHHVKHHSFAASKPPKVILMGHSVGAYILLELVRRHKEYIDRSQQADVDLIGAILLFPTIEDIAKSPLGRIAKFVLPLPGFAPIVGAIARGLASVMPQRALMRLVRFITRFPDYAASTTTLFMKSSMGVRQALHLAKDEMQTITTYKWEDEVWGAASAPGTNDRDTISWNNFSYWGQDDVWVANATRDHMIRARCNMNSATFSGNNQDMKPRMEVDTRGVPHDFCTTIENSHFMAGKVNEWIDDIISAHYRALSR